MSQPQDTDGGLLGLSLQPGMAALGPAFATAVPPAGLPDPELIAVSPEACALLGLDAARLLTAPRPDDDGTPGVADYLSGNALLPGSQPVATVYAGHQFGVWAGRLGDGRALLLGECQPQPSDGQAGSDIPAWELQLKGAGLTPYSRMADGRAVLRSSLREFLASEAMAGLGIPTTRALSLTGSRLPVQRESIESAAVVLRLAPSFIRFGHIEHFSYSGQHAALQQLLDHLIQRHFPALADEADPVAALLAEVCRRTARLIARWQSVGFTHGVLNTDNMSILGLSIDYGPFAFMDTFHFDHVPNHSDTRGRYSWANQPHVGWWNCQALAAALQPSIRRAGAIEAALAQYQPAYEQSLLADFRAKLGLRQALPADGAFIDELLRLLERNQVDFSLFFRHLGNIRRQPAASGQPDETLGALFRHPDDARHWLRTYRDRLQHESGPSDSGDSDAARQQRMHAVNPRYILRTHLAETCIRAARYHFESAPAGSDPGEAFAGIRELLTVLAHPFDEHPGHDALAGPPPDWAATLQLSCSS